MAWKSGVRLCLASDEFMAKDPQTIVNSMGVTHLHLSPMLASRLDPQTVPSVEYLVTSGEPLNAKVHRDWAGRNLYHGTSTRIIDINGRHVLIH